MNKFYFAFLSLLTAFIITSITIKQEKSGGLFEKIVWVEIDLNEDSVLFKPDSKAWDGFWEWEEDSNEAIRALGSSLMNYDRYKSSFHNRTENLWTILHPMIINGAIQPYYSYNPEAFMVPDEGELRYPLIGKDKDDTFLTSEEFRLELCSNLGNFGPLIDIPLPDEWGEDSTTVLDDGTIEYVYPAPDFVWFKDEDIIKYKLRLSVLFNKNGVEKKRIIKSIAPVVYRRDEMGEITGEMELLWLDFEELKPILKEAYYFNEDNKPVSYLEYFKQKSCDAALKVIE